MNSTASFLERIDKKYITSEKNLDKIMKSLEKDFFILSIN